MKRLNLPFLTVLVTIAAVFGIVVHVVHGVQVRRNAASILDRARRAEAGNDLEKTEEALSQYLKLCLQDGAAWEWYARIVNERVSDRRQLQRVLLVHEEALRHNPGDLKLIRRCADLAREVGRHSDAQRHLVDLLEKCPQDSQAQPPAVERAELEDLLGQCDVGLTRYNDAEQWFLHALRHDPRRIAVYDRLARLRRTELRRSEAADATIKQMVENNPEAGLAYIYRWRYAHQFAPPADAGDIDSGLKLAPDDPEVLLTAAIASEQKNDAVAARVHFERGFRLDPRNARLAHGLARLETREQHPDRAEAVLRQADRANPSLELAFELADTLISQNKIDGEDQAARYITRLENAGLGETYVRYLEAKILCKHQRWPEAIDRIENARTALRFDRRITSELNIMLADCYGHTGADDQRLAALRQAAEDDRSAGPVGVELARAMARSGKQDQAIALLIPLAERQPELRIDLVGLLIQKTSRQPRDQRNWREVEGQLLEAERALPGAAEALALLRVELLVGQDRLADARSFLSSVQSKAPRNLGYRLALARLTQRQGNGPSALQIIDQAEKDLGSSPDIPLARLDYWDREGGNAARAAVAQSAENRQRIPAADRPRFLDRLATVEIRLGEPARAREHLRELAGLRPADVPVLMGLFDLAMQAADHADARALVARIRSIEGERGTLWRFGQASELLDQARRGTKPDLEAARALAADIAARRPDWWGSSVLLAEIAELNGQSEEAINRYIQAVERGNTQAILVRRLIGLLNQTGDFDRVERVAEMLALHGVASTDLVVSAALAAIRRQDYERAIVLARQTFSERSNSFVDHLFLGNFYMAAHRPQEAGAELRRAVELGPGVPVTWVSYVQYLVRELQVERAKAVVQEASRSLPADRANLALAQCHAMVGDTGQADSMIKAALQSPACDLTAIRVAVDLYVNQGRFDKVEPILARMSDPHFSATSKDVAWANRTRALARLSTGRLHEMDRALALIEQNLNNNPNSSEDLKLKAVILSQRTSRRGDAINLLEPLDRANQLGATEQFLLARTYLAERLVDKYRAQMLKLLNINAKNPQQLAHFIDFLLAHHELDEAERWLNELAQVAPQSLSGLERTARLLDLRKSRPKLLALLLAREREAPENIGAIAALLDRFGFALEAEVAYKNDIARHPGQPERALALASFLARQDRAGDAAATLEQASKTCRPEVVAAAALALCAAPSASESLKRRAEAWVSEAIRKSPAAAVRLRAKLAAIYSRQGRYDEAEILFREVLSDDPDHADALNNLAWELALREPGDPRKALELINRAIEKAGRASSFVDTRAVALIRAGESDRAATELRMAQETDPKNASLALHLAWAYQAAGNVPEARNALAEAEKLGLKRATRHPLERTIIDRLKRQLTLNQPALTSSRRVRADHPNQGGN